MTGTIDRVIDVSERNVQATFDLQPGDCCPLTNVESDISRVLVEKEGDTCRCDLVLSVQVGEESGTMVVQVSSGIDECAGKVFDKYGCVPEVRSVNDDTITVRTFLEEGMDLQGLIDDLEAVCESVSLKQVTTNFDPSVARMCTDVDLTTFTTKQRETIETAIQRGYYRRPREVSLAELAAEFDVSEQALSQRLSRAEEKIMEQLVSDRN